MGSTPKEPSNIPIKPASKDKILKVSSLKKFEKVPPKEGNPMDLLCSRIQARMDNDERDIEKFLGDLGLMRYYDRFWDAGFTNKDVLLNQ